MNKRNLKTWIETEMHPSAEEIAEVFWHMDSEEQACFFNFLGAKDRLALQLQSVTDSTELKFDGRLAMQIIGEYGEPKMKPYEERLPLIDEAIDITGEKLRNHKDYLLWRGSIFKWASLAISYNLLDSEPMVFVCSYDEFEQRVKEREEMKNKNDWYEKGGLPPEKIYCQVKLNGEWVNCYLIGRDDMGGFVYRVDGGYGCLSDERLFRPLRTEEDELIERALDDAITNRNEELQVNPVIVNSLRKLIKAGWRPTEKKDD